MVRMDLADRPPSPLAELEIQFIVKYFLMKKYLILSANNSWAPNR